MTISLNSNDSQQNKRTVRKDENILQKYVRTTTVCGPLLSFGLTTFILSHKFNSKPESFMDYFLVASASILAGHFFGPYLLPSLFFLNLK